MGDDHLGVTRAVFLDRDGVLNELAPDPVSGLPESPLDPAQVALVAGAAGALRTLRDAGYLLVVVSNQPAAAKGLVEVEQLERVNARVVELLQAEETRLDGLHVCLHHPAGVVPELTGACTCRKPEPGLLLAAAAELGVDLQASWMVGDSDVDVAAGAAAGCRTILVEHPPSVHRRRGDAAPDARTPDLKAAAQHIVGRDRR